MTVTQRLSAFVPRTTIIGALAAAALLFGALAATRASEPAVVLPPPAVDVSGEQDGEQIAIIAGGCFWGVQAVFQHTEGVIQATSGYSGGTKQSANYDAVSGGRTDHAEAVQIRFDPKKISYGKILQIFFSVAHDPTQLNRQGPDVGPQYRTAIFTANDEQKRVTEAYIRQLDALKLYKKPIVTRVDRLEAFYPAEAYHQDYATLNPNQPYIRIHDRPKIENLKRLMPEVYRDKPFLVRAAAASN